jgi:hypothetical protein
METGLVNVLDDDDLDVPCLSDAQCEEELVRNDPPGCFYCQLRDMDWGDD